MVIKQFYNDPYQSQIDCVITSVNNNEVTVDQTIAFSYYFGQEHDLGLIGGYQIIGAQNKGKEIIYTLEPHQLQVGQQVTMYIDFVRRYRMMQLHLAAELVLIQVNRIYNKPVKLYGRVGQKKASLDFWMASNISQSFDWIISEINRLKAIDLKIKTGYLDKEKEIRYLEFVGYEKLTCQGTHLKSIQELPPIKLKRANVGRQKERIEILFENEE